MHSHKGMISIWFFIGVLLLIYRVLITASSAYQIMVLPEHPLVLAWLHAGVYWGIVLLVIGLVYTLKFRPRADVDPLSNND